MIIVILIFLLGVAVGIFGFFFLDLKRKPIGDIIVDPMAKEFQLELDDDECLQRLLNKDSKVLFRVKRTAEFTEAIMKQ